MSLNISRAPGHNAASEMHATCTLLTLFLLTYLTCTYISTGTCIYMWVTYDYIIILLSMYLLNCSRQTKMEIRQVPC